MKNLVLILAIASVMVAIIGCGDQTELPVAGDSKISPISSFEAERAEAMKQFDALEPYIAVNSNGILSFDLPNSDVGFTEVQIKEVNDIIRVANGLVRSGELRINPEFPETLLAPSGWTGMNGVVSKHWWGLILALDADATEDLILDLRSISLALLRAAPATAMSWPFTVPVAVYKIGLFAYRQAIELAARRGNGIFLWVTWTGQAFFVYPQP